MCVCVCGGGGGGGGGLAVEFWVREAISCQILYGLKTYHLSEATNFHIRAF